MRLHMRQYRLDGSSEVDQNPMPGAQRVRAVPHLPIARTVPNILSAARGNELGRVTAHHRYNQHTRHKAGPRRAAIAERDSARPVAISVPTQNGPEALWDALP